MLKQTVETQRSRKNAINELESKSSTHAQILAKEAAETEEMHEAIRVLTEQKEEHLAGRDRLQADVSSIRATIKQKREAQFAHQRGLEAQARHNIPELRFWEHCLGLQVEASGSGTPDQLRFVFTCIDARDKSSQAWFELQMGAKEYEVPETKPKLEKESLKRVVEKLNETRELGPFLKTIRVLFVDAVKT